jgi:hypothetical protein
MEEHAVGLPPECDLKIRVSVHGHASMHSNGPSPYFWVKLRSFKIAKLPFSAI